MAAVRDGAQTGPQRGERPGLSPVEEEILRAVRRRLDDRRRRGHGTYGTTRGTDRATGGSIFWRLSMKIARLVLWFTLSPLLGGGSGLLAPELHAQEGTPPEQGDAAPPDESKEEIEKRLHELEQRLAILERQKEVEQEVGAQKAKDAGTVGAGKDGFFLKSADGTYVLRLRALVQSDGRFWSDHEAKPATDTFLLRRGRPILEGTLARLFDFRVATDFGLGTTVLQDAYIDWRFAPYLKLRGGKFKTPFGLERLQSAGDLELAERALPTNLVPNRDIGLQLFGDIADGVVSYAAGAFNGVSDGGSADADINDKKETAARVFFQPFKRTSVLSLQSLGSGLAASYGDNKGTPASPGLSSYKTPGQQTFFSFRSDTPPTAAGTTVADGRRYRLSPQAYWYVWRVGALAEYVASYQKVARGTSAGDLKVESWQLTTSFALSDDRPSYKGLSPKRPFARLRADPLQGRRRARRPRGREGDPRSVPDRVLSAGQSP